MSGRDRIRHWRDSNGNLLGALLIEVCDEILRLTAEAEERHDPDLRGDVFRACEDWFGDRRDGPANEELLDYLHGRFRREEDDKLVVPVTAAAREAGDGEPGRITQVCDRPNWCPHPTCTPLRSAQNAICGGRLPAPQPHHDDFNTHRLCLRAPRPGHGIELFDLEVNAADLWWLGEQILKPLRQDAKIAYQEMRAELEQASDPK